MAEPQEAFRALKDAEQEAQAETTSRLFPLAVRALASIGLDIPETEDAERKRGVIQCASHIASAINYITADLEKCRAGTKESA